MVWGFYGQSWFIFGSEDIRRGGGVAIQWVRHEPRFKFRSHEGQLIFEANYTNTVGGNKFEFGPDRTNAVGIVGLARYESKAKSGFGGYVEGGWGLQWASQITIDLPSQLNSTPVLGAGLILPAGKNQVYAGIRCIHISNAGLKGNNPGQNQLQLMLGLRF
jgi:hypothetical protein